MTPIAERSGVDAASFASEVAAGNAPTAMRGAVADWPAVQAAIAGDARLVDYLRACDAGASVMAMRLPPSARGRIFYNAGLDGFNYSRDETTLASVLDRIVKYAAHENPASIVVQSAPVAECLPRFAAENRNPFLAGSVAPRAWIGNRVVTPAHFDESSNMACVVAGRRRFTLFPPQAIADLYIGPIGYAPTGTPISLVDFERPDARRFPRFAQALEVAQSAELEPGDAIYIPPLWWHHVASLSKVNVLVNYWWKDRAAAGTDSALNALLLAMLDLRSLPAAQRRAWAAIFEHYVFGEHEAASAHIPAARRGVLGTMDEPLARRVKAFLAAKLGD